VSGQETQHSRILSSYTVFFELSFKGTYRSEVIVYSLCISSLVSSFTYEL